MKNLMAWLPVLALVAACSKEGNPVALPTDPSPPGLQLSLRADRSQLVAGSVSPAVLTISALRADGWPAADGTTVTVNTTLGAFSFDGAGKPVQLTTITLAGGHGTTQLFAGTAAGMATVMATAGSVVATLNVPITAAPVVPVANFTFDRDGLTVIFTDTSTGAPDTYRWDFGDGQSSALRNPSHTYASAATYQVALAVTNAGGTSNKAQFVAVSLGARPVAGFDYLISGRQVNFIDASVGATSWNWNFGDGTRDTVRNPIHIYPAPGPYTVTLAASNSAGSNAANKVVTIEAGTPPKAAFTYTIFGQQVNFIDASTGGPIVWQWEFGDGETSRTRSPIHTYAAPGPYTVTLTVVNAADSDSVSQVVTIVPGTPPAAAFTFKPNGLQVNFADASTGGPTSWRWSFGDGSSSTQQNPVHVYAAYGNYTVTLTVTNASGGTTSATQIVTLAAPAP